MNTSLKIGAIAFLILAAVTLLQIKVDREYINHAPTEGQEAGIVLQTGHAYEQTFIARRPTITRLGIFLRPVQTSLPAEEVTVEVQHRETLLGQAVIPASFIDAEGSSQVRFTPALSVPAGEPVTISISVPPALSERIRLQQRVVDSTFDASNVAFTVDSLG
jgi:hypothetical protein